MCDTEVEEEVGVDDALEAELRELHERVCKAIADPKRLLIINVLRDRELSVGEISEALGVSQSNASQHLAVLRERQIVDTRRDGTSVFYRLHNPKMLQALDLMREFLRESKVAPDVTSRVTSVFLG